MKNVKNVKHVKNPIDFSLSFKERVIKIFPKKKKCKKAKWFSEEASQRAEERRQEKSKEEMENYNQLNAEFQRIAERERKAFLSEQCKEINNRLGEIRNLSKNIGDTKAIFHASLGMIKDRNRKDLSLHGK